MRDSGQLLQLIHRGLVNGGYDINGIYQALGYDARNLPLQEWRPRHDLQAYFWSRVEAVTGDPEIGLHLCPYLPVYRGQVLEYLFLSSPTFGDGLRLALRYRRLVSDALHVRLDEENEDETRILLRGTAGDAEQLRHAEICFAYEFIQIMRAVTDDEVMPSEVRLCCEPRLDAAEYRDVFGCPVSFGGEHSELAIDPAMLQKVSPHYDPSMFALHRRHAETLLESLAQQDLIDDIETYLAECFECGEAADEDCFTQKRAAVALGYSARRLRRELAAAGTSFRELLKQSRFAFARRMLRHSDESFDDIAIRCGFSEPSAFYRAFKEWAGITPSQYRDRYRPARDDTGKVVAGRFGHRGGERGDGDTDERDAAAR